ncbi:hypothetical protein UlMin_002474 [Ulmus minor]
MNSQNDPYYSNFLRENLEIHDQLFTNQNPSQSTLPSQNPTQTQSTTKKVPRSRNFAVEEDNLLASAWLNISIDAVQGNDQKSATYWQRICDYFHQHKHFTSERTANSLMHRWSAIQLSVNKFCGYYAQIDARQQSGVNEQDKIFQAKELYQQIQGQTFQFIHCWHELRHHPKWMLDGSKKKSKTRKNSSPASSSPSTATSINLEEDDVNLERPIGRKAAKAQQKKEKEKNSISPTMALFQEYREEKREMDRKKMELYEKTYDQEQERLILEKEKFRLKTQKEEERIMSIDTTNMPRLQAEYYTSLQMEIIAKRVNGSSN